MLEKLQWFIVNSAKTSVILRICYAGYKFDAFRVKNEKLTKECVLLAIQITCDVLKKNSFETMVIVKYVDKEDWFIDGKNLVEWNKNSFRLEVTVVDETCSKDQKAAYQREVYNAMEKTIGDLHPQSNVHIIDCKAASYGYTGITQEYRYQHKDEFY